MADESEIYILSGSDRIDVEDDDEHDRNTESGDVSSDFNFNLSDDDNVKANLNDDGKSESGGSDFNFNMSDDD